MVSPHDLYHSRGLSGADDSIAPPQDAGIVEIEHHYVIERSLTALQSLENLVITLDSDAPFRLLQRVRTSTGAFRFRMTNTEGAWMHSSGRNSGSSTEKIRDANFFGTAQLPGLFLAPMLFKPGGIIKYDLEDVSNATNAIQIVFSGVKLYQR